MKNAASKNLSDTIYTGYKLLDNFDDEFTVRDKMNIVKDKMNIVEKLTVIYLYILKL